MPTYDYNCTKCGKEFEIFHGMMESPEITCPECNGNAKKIISGGTGIIFRGSGFYVTDNSGSPKPAAVSGTGESTPAPAEKKKKKQTENAPTSS